MKRSGHSIIYHQQRHRSVWWWAAVPAMGSCLEVRPHTRKYRRDEISLICWLTFVSLYLATLAGSSAAAGQRKLLGVTDSRLQPAQLLKAINHGYEFRVTAFSLHNITGNK